MTQETNFTGTQNDSGYVFPQTVLEQMDYDAAGIYHGYCSGGCCHKCGAQMIDFELVGEFFVVVLGSRLGVYSVNYCPKCFKAERTYVEDFTLTEGMISLLEAEGVLDANGEGKCSGEFLKTLQKGASLPQNPHEVCFGRPQFFPGSHRDEGFFGYEGLRELHSRSHRWEIRQSQWEYHHGWYDDWFEMDEWYMTNEEYEEYKEREEEERLERERRDFEERQTRKRRRRLQRKYRRRDSYQRSRDDRREYGCYDSVSMRQIIKKQRQESRLLDKIGGVLPEKKRGSCLNKNSIAYRAKRQYKRCYREGLAQIFFMEMSESAFCKSDSVDYITRIIFEGDDTFCFDPGNIFPETIKMLVRDWKKCK